MKTKHLLTVCAAALCTFAVFPASLHAATLAYTVTDLGTFGNTANYAQGINASGQVTGYSDIAGNSTQHVLAWTGTTPADLGTLGGTYNQGVGINSSGQVAGFSSTTGNSAKDAVVWTGTTPTILTSLGGLDSYATGINDSGQVAGVSEYFGGSSRAVVWTGTSPTVLGNFGLSGYSYATAINNSTQVAGVSTVPGNGAGAVRWTGTVPAALGTLGGAFHAGFVDSISSVASGINASGQITGYAYLPDNQTIHAVVWTGTTPTDLVTLGGTSSQGYGINNSGEVVGMSSTIGNIGYNAFLYTGGIMYDLNVLLLPGSGVTNLGVVGANSINDLGQIAAYGTIGGQTHALRLDPVAAPEPASAVLLLGGTALLGLRRRR